MEIYKNTQEENFTIVVSRDELREIKDALGMRCLYLEALLRKKTAIARSKDIPKAQEIQNDRSHNMYIQIAKEIE